MSSNNGKRCEEVYDKLTKQDSSPWPFLIISTSSFFYISLRHMQYYLSNIPSYHTHTHTHTTPYINPSVPITFPNLWYFFSFSSPFYLFHIHLHLMFLSMIPNIFIIFLLWSGFWLRPGRGGRYGWCTLWRLHCKVQYGEMESERENRRETDRKCARRKIQTDTLIDWQTDRQTDIGWQIDRQTHW